SDTGEIDFDGVPAGSVDGLHAAKTRAAATSEVACNNGIRDMADPDATGSSILAAPRGSMTTPPRGGLSSLEWLILARWCVARVGCRRGASDGSDAGVVMNQQGDLTFKHQRAVNPRVWSHDNPWLAIAAEAEPADAWLLVMNPAVHMRACADGQVAADHI